MRQQTSGNDDIMLQIAMLARGDMALRRGVPKRCVVAAVRFAIE
jgi:hypothetical protein